MATFSDSVLPSAMAWTSAHGLMMAAPGNGCELLPAPFALYPVKFPKAMFDHGYALATPYNRLYDAVASDTEWLLETLAITASVDEFTGRLVALQKEVQARGVTQPITLGIHRSDYMLHEEGEAILGLRQVEFNTISVSLACLAAKVSGLHRFMCMRFPEEGSPEVVLPENKGDVTIAASIATAHKLYGDPKAVVLFIVQPCERNVMDQRTIEFQLWDQHLIPCIRLTLAEIASSCSIGPDNELLIQGSKIPCVSCDAAVPVSVAYYRAGYTPNDYKSEDDWAARHLIEHSKAIKCPNIAYHLAGTKKVQQALAAPGVVERFVSSDDAALIRTSFAGLWSLDPGAPGKEDSVAAAIATPYKYVLKPQREGGGNNFYNNDVKDRLTTMSEDELAAYILMERIFPPPQKSPMVRSGTLTIAHTVTEFGVYSVFIKSGAEVVLDASAGHLMRTKSTDSDEGGVVAGFSVLDSPQLV